jgi:ribonuclease Z
MRPVLHPTLVNGRFGDPVLYLERQFERHAILFDLGSIEALSPRQIQRVEQIFVSHAHIDHFIGFDRLLRILVGRAKKIHLYGPAGFADRVSHKLHGYQWNLVDRYLCDLVFVVTEIDARFETRTISFRLKKAFAWEEAGKGYAAEGVLHSDKAFAVSCAILDHRTPCLAFAIEDVAHVNIWKNRLAELGLPVGSWLRDLKRAVIDNKPDDYLIHIGSQAGLSHSREMPLGMLRDVFTVTQGQKIGYVTDVADSNANRRAIMRLVHGVDILFIEAVFAAEDGVLAAERAHLTTVAAGEIGRAAKARRLEPFHFSPRYLGEERRMLAEVVQAFIGADRDLEPEGEVHEGLERRH